MGEAAPQAAEDMSDEDAKALEVLRLFWEPEYLVGYDDEQGWWATENGVVGRILIASSAEQLGRLLGDEAGTAR